MNKTVLLLNQGHTNNYGDIAINRVISAMFKKSNYNVEQQNFWSEKDVFGNNYSNYPKIIRWILWHSIVLMDFFNKKNIKRIISKKKYDLIVIGGGELLGLNYGFNSSLYTWTSIAKKEKIPIIIYGVSGTPKMSKIRLLRNQIALRKCKIISVRDNTTKSFIKEKYGINCNCYPDCAFAYRTLFGSKSEKKVNKDSILIAPIMFYDLIAKGLSLKSEDDYLEYLYETLMCEVHKMNVTNIIVTCTEKEDQIIANKLGTYLTKKEKKLNVKVCNYSTIEDYISLLKRSKIVISGRMHAMILGIIYGCSIKPIKFKDKLISFDKEYTNNDNKNIELIAYDSMSTIIKMIEEKNEK